MPSIENKDPSEALLPLSKDFSHADETSYATNHWVFQPLTFSNPKVIALAFYEQSTYAIYLNPTDKRGYRSIVRLIDNTQMSSTINREYTSSERIGLALIMSMVTEAYTRLVPIAQNAVAGNNAHSFDPNTGVTSLGNAEEPVFLHGHIYGRGNPHGTYIDDVPLDGPAPGYVFDMRAQTSDELGNDKKVSWKTDQINKVVHRLRIEINQLSPIYQARGLTVVTENKFIDVYFVRHGETDWNVQRRLQGHTDIPLNDVGQLQAQKLSKKLESLAFAKVWASDLARAYQTAQWILGPNSSCTIEKSPFLRERSFGPWEGRLFNELQVYLKEHYDIDSMTEEQYLTLAWDNGVESYAHVYRRIEAWLRTIFLDSTMPEGPILAVSHGGVIRAILSRLKYQPGFRWEVTNTALVKLRISIDGQTSILDSEGVKLAQLNPTS